MRIASYIQVRHCVKAIDEVCHVTIHDVDSDEGIRIRIEVGEAVLSSHIVADAARVAPGVAQVVTRVNTIYTFTGSDDELDALVGGIQEYDPHF